MIQIRPSTLQDFIDLDGQTPKQSVRAMSAVNDCGKVVALWGIYPHKTRWLLFSHLSNEFKADKRNIAKGCKVVWEMLEERPFMPVIAIADEDTQGSDVLLQHMGFKQVSGRVYQWLG